MFAIPSLFQAQIGMMKDFQGYYVCSPGQDMNSAAAAMEDLASVIEDVGMETLQQELGIEVNSVFDFNN